MAQDNSSKVTFRRINGRIIPIRAAQLAVGAGAAIGAFQGVNALKKASKKSRGATVTPNRGLQALGFGAAVADGLISGATLTGGGKKFLFGQGASIGLSVGSTSANVASYAGTGKARARLKGAAKQEAINTLAGNAAFVGTALAIPSSRKVILDTTIKALNFFKGKIGMLL